MCLYPKIIKNPRYSQYKLKKGDIKCDDFRKMYIPIGCGKCYECKKQKAHQWQVRLTEELKTQKYSKFVTLTFSNEELKKLCEEIGEKECNAVATIAVRRFLERYRKHNGKSLRHWLITEMGHQNTERIHLHGIIFPPEEITNEDLQKYWKYGLCDTGQYCNLQTINYIVKYVTKVDVDHKGYEPVILASAGIGSEFVKSNYAQNLYKYKKGESPEYYVLPNGNKVALPIYYRNKLYDEKTRQKLWTDRLDKKTIYVNGIKIRNIDTIEANTEYNKILRTQQAWNRSVGYGDRGDEWKKREYNVTFKMLNYRKH